MAIKDKLTQEFLEGLEEVKTLLLILMFKQILFNEKGLAYFVQYQRGKTIVEFLFGPSEWNVEMIVYTTKGKFAFKDLLEIPAIAKWVSDNRYKQEGERSVKNELLWFIELLKVSLPIID
jgi:hypothetical protein